MFDQTAQPRCDAGAPAQGHTRVLVTAASRHGSTKEIAQVITNELRRAGYDVDLRDAETVLYLDGYDAVILGSAIYLSNWLPEAREFAERHRRRLARMPVWLFSSGPVGEDESRPNGKPARAGDLLRLLLPRDHQMFVGKLDTSVLNFSERLAVKVVGAPEGDFRDWAAIRAWARAIGAELRDGQIATADRNAATLPAAEEMAATYR